MCIYNLHFFALLIGYVYMVRVSCWYSEPHNIIQKSHTGVDSHPDFWGSVGSDVDPYQ